MNHEVINQIDLKGNYVDLSQYIGELPETMIYSMVWRENMKKVNKEYLFRTFIYKDKPYDNEIDTGGLVLYKIVGNYNEKEAKKDPKYFLKVLDKNRYIQVQLTRHLINESQTDLEKLNSSEMADAMEMSWNYDDLDKESHRNDFIGINFGSHKRPEYDPDDPYYANKYDKEFEFDPRPRMEHLYSYNYKQFRGLRETPGKIYKLPKRYRYSSGKESMYGYKDCECGVCWDRKCNIKMRVKELGRAFEKVVKEQKARIKAEEERVFSLWKAGIEKVNREYKNKVEIEPLNANLELIESYLFKVQKRGRKLEFYFNYRKETFKYPKKSIIINWFK